MAYGGTGTGKTYTMEGPESLTFRKLAGVLSTPSVSTASSTSALSLSSQNGINLAVIPASLYHIFDSLRSQQATSSSSSPSSLSSTPTAAAVAAQPTIQISVYQIYMEKIVDLMPSTTSSSSSSSISHSAELASLTPLTPPSSNHLLLSPSSSSHVSTALGPAVSIVEGQQRNQRHLAGLSHVTVTSPEEAWAAVRGALQRRAKAQMGTLIQWMRYQPGYPFLK